MRTTPFGLGWTERIGGPELVAGLTPREAYARRLFLAGAIGPIRRDVYEDRGEIDVKGKGRMRAWVLVAEESARAAG